MTSAEPPAQGGFLLKALLGNPGHLGPGPKSEPKASKSTNPHFFDFPAHPNRGQLLTFESSGAYSATPQRKNCMTTEASPARGNIIDKLESQYLRTDLPQFRVGDTITVNYRIVEGDKTRVQAFKGLVIKRHRAGARSTFTVRKTSFTVGVERTFVLHSPRIESIAVEARGVVRRARLFYLRDLTGKKARVREQKDR